MSREGVWSNIELSGERAGVDERLAAETIEIAGCCHPAES